MGRARLPRPLKAVFEPTQHHGSFVVTKGSSGWKGWAERLEIVDFVWSRLGRRGSPTPRRFLAAPAPGTRGGYPTPSPCRLVPSPPAASRPGPPRPPHGLPRPRPPPPHAASMTRRAHRIMSIPRRGGASPAGGGGGPCHTLGSRAPSASF